MTPSSSDTLQVFDSITEEVMATIPSGTAKDVDAAERAAKAAFESWSSTSIEERAKRVARRLRTGQVEINGGAFNANAPFGGYKQSGIGREYGMYGLEEFLEIKSLQP